MDSVEPVEPDCPFVPASHTDATSVAVAALILLFALPIQAQHKAEPEREIPAVPVLTETEIQDKVAQEKQAHGRYAERMKDTQHLVRVALLKDDPDDRLRTLLTAEEMVRETAAAVQTAGLRELLETTERALAKMPESTDNEDPRLKAKRETLLEQRSELQTMHAADLAAKCRVLQKSIVAAIRQTPPPTRFRQENGLDMVLVKTEKDMFYISRAPVSQANYAVFVKELGRSPEDIPDVQLTQKPAGNGEVPTAVPARYVSQKAAVAYCAWLSQKAGSKYDLPSLAQLRAARIRSNCALWSATEWKEKDHHRTDSRGRFGVPMVAVHDPDKHFKSGTAFGELTFCRYEQVGFVIVTSVQTGIRARLERLRAEE